MSVHDSVPQHQVQVDLGTGLELLPGVAWSVSRALSGSGLPGQARAVSGSSVATGTLTVVDGRTPWTAQAIAAGGAVRIDAALDAHLPLTRVATMRARSLDASGARAVDRSLSIEDDLAGLLAPITVPARIPSAPVDLSTVITDLATVLGLPSDVQPSGVLVPAVLPEGRTGWEVCQWVASVTLGACWLSETGVLTYRGPAAMRGQGTPTETIHTLPQVVDLPWSQSTDDVADRVTLTYTPITVERVTDYSLTVWESTETLTVAAGATVVVEQDLETAVDELASWLPVWSTTAPEGQRSRWAASTQPDGGGARPADTALTVTSTLVTATRVRITITNTTSGTLYVGGGQPTQLLTLRANVRATRAAQVTLAAGADETAARATLAVDMGTGITSEAAGRTLLGWLAAQTAAPRATLSQIQVVPDLGRRLGDLVQVADPITGLSSRCIISGIHLAAQAGSLTQAMDLVLVDGVAPSPPTVVPVVTGSAGTSSSSGISAVEQARREEADRTDVSQPSVPSAPVLGARLGVLSIAWDGLSNTGGAVSDNLSHVEVALGATAGATTVVDRIERGGGTVHVTGLPYNALRYVRLRGVSRNGVASAWSAERSHAVTPLVDADLIATTIQTQIDAAQQAADAAQATADGRNRVTYSTSAPSGTGSAVGDTWWQRDGAGRIIGQWEWTGSAWTPRTIESALIANLDAGKITAGTLDAARIAAESITAAKLATGSVTAGKIFAGAVTTAALDALAVTADKIAANAVTADKILAGAVTTTKLDALAVTAEKVAAGAITTDKLDALAVTAGKIAADAITSTKIAGDAIDGKTITGATIRTAATGQRVQLDTGGVKGYDAAGTLITHLSNSGVLWSTDARLTGRLTTTGSRGTTSVDGGGVVAASGGYSVELASGGIEAYRGTTRTLRLVADTWGASMQATADLSLTAQSGNFYLNGKYLYLTGAQALNLTSTTSVIVDGGNSSRMQVSGQDGIIVSAESNLPYVSMPYLRDRKYAAGASTIVTCNSLGTLGVWGAGAAGTLPGNVTVAGNLVVENRVVSVKTYETTSTLATSVGVTETGYLFRSTSRRDAKVAIEDAPDTWADAFWGLRPRTWIDRADAERLADGLDREAHGENVDWDDIDVSPLHRVPGFIAEEVADAGLTGLVTYDRDGQITGLAYDRMLTAAVLAMRGMREQITDLTTRLTALEATP